MKKPLKAALLSGLVFPGVGQIVLERYGRAAALSLASMGCLFLIVQNVYHVAQAAVDQLVSAGGEVDITAISDAATKASNAVGSPMTTVAAMVLAGCWIIGIVDALRSKEAKSP